MEEEIESTAAVKSYPVPEVEYEKLVESPELFLQKLRNFHSAFLTHFTTPCFNGTPLDLHRLFVEVTSRGGLDQVIRDRKWESVVSSFKFGTSSVKGSFLLRKYYMSLLYHFEQAYLFRKREASISCGDALSQIANVGSTVDSSKSVEENLAFMVSLQGSLQLEPGISLVGVIDEKFENGYVVSVNVGPDKLKGVLYHIPDPQQTTRSTSFGLPQHRKRKKSRLSLLDPSKVKPPNSEFDFSTENYASVKSLSQVQEDWASTE